MDGRSLDHDGCRRELNTPAVELRFHEPLHLVKIAQRQAQVLPLVEMLGNGDGAALARRAPNAEVLVEGLAVTRDGWLVLSRLLPDVVGFSIRGQRAHLITR